MTFDETLSQILFWTIALLSFAIAYEFYKSKNGRLRLLMIELFLTKGWVYGGAGLYYILVYFGYLLEVPFVYIRILLTLPMAFVMLKLWRYVRNNM